MATTNPHPAFASPSPPARPTRSTTDGRRPSLSRIWLIAAYALDPVQRDELEQPQVGRPANPLHIEKLGPVSEMAVLFAVGDERLGGAVTESGDRGEGRSA